MSLSTRAATLLLGSCLFALGANADAQEQQNWFYGDVLASDEEAAPAEAWLVDYTGISVQAVKQQKSRTPKPPSSLVPPPTRSSTPNNTGAGILVAVVDTGIFLSHPEFSGRVVNTSTCFGGSGVCSGTGIYGNDDHGHGTHVAGIIASASNGTGNTGVAPGASLMAVKVLDKSGSGTFSAVGQGISYAATNGARVINMSLGGSSGWSGLISPLQTAAQTAVIVAAAGNSGNAFAPGYPAAYATQEGIVGSMLIVGSVRSNNVISSFSQTPGEGGCNTVGLTTTCFKDVFVVAPGENIYSAYLNNGYATMSGTSMATPYVSGVAARVLAAHPFLTNTEAVQIILQSTIDLGDAGTDAVYGRGLVSLTNALAPLGSTSIATSGGTPSMASGTGEVSGSGISGTLGASLRNSNVAKNVVFFDAFGRDYRTDLTRSIANSSVSLLDTISRAPWDAQFVSFSGPGYSVSGFAPDRSQNSVQSLSFAEDIRDDLSDVVVTAQLTDNTRLTFGHNASTTGRVNMLDLAADDRFDGLFMSASAMNSPYLALSSGGDFASAAFQFSEDVTVSFAHSRLGTTTETAYPSEVLASDQVLAKLTDDIDHARSAQSTAASVNWNFSSWGSAGLTAAFTEEGNSLLGTTETGALAMTSSASTTSIGLSAKADLGDRWTLTAAWSFGRTEATPVADGLIQSFSDIESQSYGVAISKTGVFEDDDNLGFAISRPLHITGGTASLIASTGISENREIIYSHETVQLASSTPETDYELGYTARLSESTTLQTNFIYQQNAGGDANEDAIAGVVSLKTHW